MNWPDAETAIRARIEEQWPQTAYGSLPLVFENELDDYVGSFMAVMIEGNYAEKTIFGSTGLRSSVEMGIVYYHAFVPTATGKVTALSAVNAMSGILELQSLQTYISFDGANPPTPVEMASAHDRELPTPQPSGMFFRCSGSVPFIVIGSR